MLNVLFMALLGGCGDLAAEGDACVEDADCADGLHCHMEADAEEGACEADGDDDHGDDHDDGADDDDAEGCEAVGCE